MTAAAVATPPAPVPTVPAFTKQKQNDDDISGPSSAASASLASPPAAISPVGAGATEPYEGTKKEHLEKPQVLPQHQQAVLKQAEPLVAKSTEPKSYADILGMSRSSFGAGSVTAPAKHSSKTITPGAPAAAAAAVTVGSAGAVEGAQQAQSKPKKAEGDYSHKQQTPPPPSLYINQIDETVTKEQLTGIFSKYGKLKVVDLNPKGYAFVEVSK